MIFGKKQRVKKITVDSLINLCQLPPPPPLPSTEIECQPSTNEDNTDLELSDQDLKNNITQSEDTDHNVLDETSNEGEDILWL